MVGMLRNACALYFLHRHVDWAGEAPSASESCTMMKNARRPAGVG